MIGPIEREAGGENSRDFSRRREIKYPQLKKRTADGRRFTQMGRVPSVSSGILADLDSCYASPHLDFKAKEMTAIQKSTTDTCESILVEAQVYLCKSAFICGSDLVLRIFTLRFQGL